MTFPATSSPALPATLAALPHQLPDCPNARVALFAMRRMGAHGLADARAAHALFTAFGEGFRRPLMMLRTVMADIAASASTAISIAPCCCARMTAAERALVTLIARSETQPGSAYVLLRDLLAQQRVDGVLASITALAASFADAGRPICEG